MGIAVVCRVESKHMTVVWPSGSRVGVAPKFTDRGYAPSARLEYGSKSGAIFVDLFTSVTPNPVSFDPQPSTRNSQAATLYQRIENRGQITEIGMRNDKAEGMG